MLKKILILIVLAAGCGGNLDEVNLIIDKVKKELAPDTRIAVCDIQASLKDGHLYLEGQTDNKRIAEKIEKLLKEENVKVKNKIEILPSAKLGNKVFGITRLSVINLRYAPKAKAELVTQGLLGMPLKILDVKGDWYRVQTPDKYIAWTEGYGFVRVTGKEITEWKESKKIIFTDENGYAFTKPDDKSMRVSDLTLLNILKLIGTEGNYYEVIFPDGRKAFVKKTQSRLFDLWLAERRPTPENIISDAEKFIGLPYLWGGTSARGLDCSGFTKTVFFMNGILLPRDASQQVFAGRPVDTRDDFSKLKPGDLLFFGSKATSKKKERITHVGIYLGDNEFIHESGLVKINSFDINAPNFNEKRLKGFVKARRILGVKNSDSIQLISRNEFYN